MAKISVIVPAYNAARYLQAAIDSVISQSYEDWEMLLIDDGSSDSTPAICDRAARMDSRIKVFHKPNGGLSDARNYALDRVSTPWITFLDGDDLLHPKYLSTLINTAQQRDAEVACVAFVEFDSVDSPFLPGANISNRNLKERLLTPEEAVSEALYRTGCMDNSVGGKLYKLELWDNLRFTPHILYEDLDIFYKVLLRAKKVASLNIPLYGYRQHSGSILHNFNLRRADVLDVTDRMAEWLEKNSPCLTAAAHNRRLSAHYNIFGLLNVHSRLNAGGVSESFRKKWHDLESRCWQVICEERISAMRDSKSRAAIRISSLFSIIGGKRALRVMAKLIYRR